MLLFTFSVRPQKFWGRSEQIFQKSPCRYLSSWRLKANIWIFQIAFSRWIAEKKIVFRSFIGQDFICRWEKFHLSQSSYSSFLQNNPVFWVNNVQILFFCLNIFVFTLVKNKKTVFGKKKWVKSCHLLFIIFSLSNCNYSSVVHWIAK